MNGSDRESDARLDAEIDALVAGPARAADPGARVQVTREQMRDPHWCRANQELWRKALRERRLEIVD